MKKVLRKWIWKIIKIVGYIAILIYVSFRFALVVSKNKDKLNQRNRIYYMIMVKWMDLMEEGISLCKYLKKNDFNQVAIYGTKEMGQHLMKQLEKKGVIVKYFIDKNAFQKEIDGRTVYQPNSELPDADAIIVTPVWDYQNIKEQLEKWVHCPIISLEDMIAEAKNA